VDTRAAVGSTGQGAGPGPDADVRSGAVPRGALRLVIAIGGTLALCALLVWLLGASPLEAAKAIIVGSVGSAFALEQTITVTGILILTALAAAVPFTAKLWNVGGEGQMTIGAVTAAVLGIVLPADWPAALMIPVIVMTCLITGAFWAAIAGWLKARFDTNEIVSTLMLNFIAGYLAVWVISEVFPQGFVNRTDDIHPAAELPGSGLTGLGIWLALGAAVAVWILMSRTRPGFEIRAIGANPRASQLAGISPQRVTVRAFVVAGACAGLAGTLVVLGRDHALLERFSANFGFLGIGVALVARLHPLAILPVAFAFGALRVGSNSLQAVAGLSPSMGEILVATLVVLLMVLGVIRFRYPVAADAL
jgi:general nucleoside transport system permease protein